MNNEPIININLSKVQGATLVGLVHDRVRFFKNELKKKGQAESYVEFCKGRLDYYSELEGKLVIQGAILPKEFNMKLRNKKTGEIVEATDFNIISDYNSLAELNEEWEDYEEQKEHYFITEYGGVYSLAEYEGLNNVANVEDYKQLGNYFETKEDAKKVVEKLKAFKRLKDKGFRFSNFAYTELCDYARVNISATMINDHINDDLELLFGDEE